MSSLRRYSPLQTVWAVIWRVKSPQLLLYVVLQNWAVLRAPQLRVSRAFLLMPRQILSLKLTGLLQVPVPLLRVFLLLAWKRNQSGASSTLGTPGFTWLGMND